MTVSPRRIVLIKPCCMGDVIFATPLLMALRRAYPHAAIDWAVSDGAMAALRDHPDIAALIPTGKRANPASRPDDLIRLTAALRRGRYEMAVVPDRSRLMGIPPLLAGIPVRAGLDSAGRGFSYTIRAPVDPAEIRHEAEIYLDVARVLGLPTERLYTYAPPSEAARRAAESVIGDQGLAGRPFVVIHPGGGVNAGMTMTEKRWPPARFAEIAERLTAAYGAAIVIVGAGTDRAAAAAVIEAAAVPVIDLVGRLNLAVTAALAVRSLLYIGNDTGMGHLACAAGARTMMIFGPSDPRRYAPYGPPERTAHVWRPVALPAAGVSAGAPRHFDWARDGVSVDEVWEAIRALLPPAANSPSPVGEGGRG